MATQRGGRKKRAEARAATKNYRRWLRRGGPLLVPVAKRTGGGKPKPKWMRDAPVMKKGMGGTDKSHRGGRKKRGVFYSDKPATGDQRWKK